MNLLLSDSVSGARGAAHGMLFVTAAGPARRPKPPVRKENFVTAPALTTRKPASLQALLERLGRHHFSDTPLSIGDNGAVVAQFYRSRITSAFQPVVRARGHEVVGHQALL